MGPTKSLTNLLGVFPKGCQGLWRFVCAIVCPTWIEHFSRQPPVEPADAWRHKQRGNVPWSSSRGTLWGGENFRVAATYSNMSFLGWHFRAENHFFGCLLATSCCFFLWFAAFAWKTVSVWMVWCLTIFRNHRHLCRDVFCLESTGSAYTYYVTNAHLFVQSWTTNTTQNTVWPYDFYNLHCLHYLPHFISVDGSEIPRPTTVGMVLKPGI